MRIAVDAGEGELASSPEDAVSGLLALACADGADPQEWIEKAFRKMGGMELLVEANAEPAEPIVKEASDRALQVWDKIRFLMMQELTERIQQARREAAAER